MRVLNRRRALLASLLVGLCCQPVGTQTGTARQPSSRTTAADVPDLESPGILARTRLRGSGALLPDGACTECVTAIFLVADPDRTTQWEETLRRAGAVIGFEHAAIGYVRADLSVQAWNSLRQSELLSVTQLSGQASVRDTFYEDEVQWTVRPTPPRPAQESERRSETTVPELPVERFRELDVSIRPDIGADTWLAEHPTWDGRGITIAFVGDVVGLSDEHPLLKDAYTLEGATTRKIVARIASTDPRAIRVRGASPFADVLTDISAASTVVERNGRQFRLPAPGNYSLGLWRTDEQVYDVLIDWQKRTAWVDIKGDNDFSRATPLRDATSHHDRMPNRGGVPVIAIFGPGASRSLRLVALRNGHDSMVVTAAAGNDSAAGIIGVAPGASALLIESGTLLHTLLEAHIVAASHPNVDIISASTSNIGVDSSVETLRSHVFDRLARVYGKPTFLGSGNGGPAIGTLAGGDGTEEIHVGAYASKRVLSGITGLTLSEQDLILPYSGRGPRADGMMKPELVAPAPQIVGRCAGRTARIGAFVLPACYGIAEGTSTATPTAAGVAALVLSAARQNKITNAAANLRTALLSGARPLDGWSVLEQGWGVINVQGAWNMLRRMQASPDAPAHRASDVWSFDVPTSAACHKEQLRLSRDMLSVGRNDDLVVEVRPPSTAPSRAATHAAGSRWPKTAPEHSTTIMVCPGAPGIAAGQVIARTASSRARVMLKGLLVRTVLPLTLTPKDDRRQAATNLVIPFMRHAELPVRVPDDVPFLDLRLTVSTGAVRLRVHEPSMMSTLYRQPENRQDQLGRIMPAGTHTVRVPRPQAGDWTIALVNDNGIDQSFKSPPVPAHVALEIVAGPAQRDITARRSTPESAAVVPTPVRLTNAPSLESTRGQAAGIRAAWDREWQLYDPFDIVVGAGTSRMRIEPQAAPGVIAYLFKCTSGTCTLYDTNLEGGAGYVFDVERPAAGRWVLIAGRSKWTDRPAPFEARVVRLSDTPLARGEKR
jgi:subtilisin family serine protease